MKNVTMTLFTLTGISSNLCYTDEKVRDLYINETPEDPLPVSVSPTQYTHSLVSAVVKTFFSLLKVMCSFLTTHTVTH